MFEAIMRPTFRTNWRLTPKQAVRLQERLRERVVVEDKFDAVRSVAGADLAFDPDSGVAFAGVIVYRFPSLEEIERKSASRLLSFPYVPGLLSFREGPALLAAFARLNAEPDLILIDGHGRAHPRRFGIACHLGVLLDKPVIGCAKSILVGQCEEPAPRAGSMSRLMLEGQCLGMALRTRSSVKPIYVTQGNRVSLATAVELVEQCLDGFRIPKPTREADHYVGALRREYQKRVKGRMSKVESKKAGGES